MKDLTPYETKRWKQLGGVPDEPGAALVAGTPESQPREARCAVATGSPAAGRADELRREGRRWWRLEQKAVRRRDYTAAKEYAALSDKYYAQADAAEQENVQR